MEKQTNPLIKISPSILAGDLSQIALEAKRLEKAEADSIHIDVMDGHFVPNLTFGPAIVAAINRSTNLFLDVHLMMYNPFEYIEKFVAAGADRLTIHFEATEDVEYLLNYIRKCGVKSGLAFNPETSASFIPKYLDKCDMILFMSVHPGACGQTFMPEVLEKLKFTRQVCEETSIFAGGQFIKDKAKQRTALPFDLGIDGGVKPENIKSCLEAGANVIISGAYLFKEKDMGKAILKLRS